MLDRFTAAALPDDPQSLQLLFFDPPVLDAEAITAFLRPHVPDAVCELAPAPPDVVTQNGPPASQVGLISFGGHLIKLFHFDAPMPYGPVESCVGPAMIPPPMKVDSKQHKAHTLLFNAGTHPDLLERFVALCAVAGALARFDAIVVMNEEARAAVPAFDLIPDDGEDALNTYRNLPIPYLLGGFLKMDTGDAERPWVRTFANHRLNLPNLARQLSGHSQTGETFQLFAGMLGYLRTMGEAFTAGDTVDLGDGPKLQLREPREGEWWLDSPGPLLVVESQGYHPGG
ncbi:MAG: hypothetical protein MUF18_20660 [Fimbriiglobus sp.]|jgi:hypothetical protein|nr:hypothetical protein [Fimbriiglobus sp.]